MASASAPEKVAKAVQPQDEAQTEVKTTTDKETKTKAKSVPARVECFIHYDHVPANEAYIPACNHPICRHCLTTYFLYAVESRDDFRRPGCCNIDYPLEWAREVLRPRRFTQFRDLCEELEEQQNGEYFYCADIHCGRYIPRRHRRRNILICSCKRQTCRHCRLQAHPPNSCDEAWEQYVEKASQTAESIARGDTQALDTEEMERMGCRYCPYCLAIIHRTQGCRHMLCNCGCNFDWETAELFKANGEPPKRRMPPLHLRNGNTARN